MNRKLLTKILLIVSSVIFLLSAGVHSYALSGSPSVKAHSLTVYEESEFTIMSLRTADEYHTIDAFYPKTGNFIINSEIEMLIDETISRFKSLYDKGVLRIAYKSYRYTDFIIGFEFDIYEQSGQTESWSKIIRNYDLIGGKQVGLFELFDPKSDCLEFFSEKSRAYINTLGYYVSSEYFTSPCEANFKFFTLDSSFLYLMLDFAGSPGILAENRYTTVSIPIGELGSRLISDQHLRSYFEDLSKASGESAEYVDAFSGSNRYDWEKPGFENAPFIIPEDQLPVETPKFVALTFDDGPLRKTTERLLDALSERQVRATFFMLGYRMESSPDLVKRMVNEGHAVGNHTYNHKLLNTLNRDALEYQLKETNRLIQEAGGVWCNLLRPPFGARNADTSAIAKEEGMSLILWDIDPRDWESKDAKQIAEHIISRTKDGNIILLHDIYESSVDAAILAIDALAEKGFVFLTVDELINMYSELEAGAVYRTGKGKEKVR